MTMSNGLGDLAQTLVLRRANVALREQLTRLTEEVTTGRAADPLGHLGGDLTALSGLERDLALGAAWRSSRTEAAGMAAAQQLVLSEIEGRLSAGGPLYLGAAAGPTGLDLPSLLAQGAQDFEAVVSALNGSYGGRALFAGTATQSAALAPPATILADLSAAIAGATTGAEVIAAAEAYFLGAGGGFETGAYTGSEDPLAPHILDDTESIRLDITARDTALRRSLMPMALAALMADGLFSGDAVERDVVLKHMGESMLQANGEVIGLQARLGGIEARIEAADVRSDVRDTSLQTARSRLVGVDPYETSTRLEQTTLQLEAVYALTARLAGLSLVGYLR